MYTNFNFHPKADTTPQHVAIIPDGGRRWAKQSGITYKESYLVSMKRMVDISDVLYRNGIKYVSFYFASSQNFLRNWEEIKSFYEAEYIGVKDELAPYAHDHGIELKIVGNRDERYKMPEEDRQLVQSEKKMFICFNYNSLDEIEKAFHKKTDMNISFVNYLDIPYPIDILIRTGGAQTLSGFMLPQLAFARLFFVNKLFNDFTVEDAQEILLQYKKYNLKYGE